MAIKAIPKSGSILTPAVPMARNCSNSGSRKFIFILQKLKLTQKKV
jgi:hypothetical protein